MEEKRFKIMKENNQNKNKGGRNVKIVLKDRMTLITAVKLDRTEHAHWTTFNPTLEGF